MSQFNPREVLYFNKYYCYDEELYALTFPLEWAKKHSSKTGPKECISCSNVGMWNGVFIGYCVSCADSYNGQRGVGFVTHGREQCVDDNKKHLSAFSTYLKNIKMSDIGDKDIFMDTEEMIRDRRPMVDYTNINVCVCDCDELESEEMRLYHEDRQHKRFNSFEDEEDDMTQEEWQRQYDEERRCSEEEDERLDMYYNPAAYSMHSMRSVRGGCR